VGISVKLSDETGHLMAPANHHKANLNKIDHIIADLE
jgi:hypothetical protein